MHPAKSVIYFTTASGAGYGLLVWGYVFYALGLLEPLWGLGVAIFGTAGFLVITGLLSSTLHLGHPERAWRALSQWRSSWLSREGVLALLTFIPAAVFAVLWLGGDTTNSLFLVFGGLTAALSLMTVFSTGKIYSTLKAVPAWSNPLTVPGYLVLSLLTGGILFLPISELWFQDAYPAGRLVLLFLIVLGLGLKLVYWRAIRENPVKETASGATGLKGKVTLLEGPHDQENYLMKEMGFKIARKHAARLRAFATAFLFMLPLAAIFFSGYAPNPDMAFGLLTVAVFFTAIGIALERWLFFAEAKHVQTLYYGDEEV